MAARSSPLRSERISPLSVADVASASCAESITAFNCAACAVTVSPARVAASPNSPPMDSSRSRSCIRRVATASPRTSARAPASSSAAIWFCNTFSSARRRWNAPSMPAFSASSSWRTVRPSLAAVLADVSSAVTRSSTRSDNRPTNWPIACPRANAQAIAMNRIGGARMTAAKSATSCTSSTPQPRGPT